MYEETPFVKSGAGRGVTYASAEQPRVSVPPERPTPLGPLFWATCVGSTIVLFVVLVACNFYSFYHINAVAFALITLLFAEVFALEGARRGMLKLKQLPSRFVWVPIVAALGATVLGIVIGSATFNSFSRPAGLYNFLRVYENALPSTPAAAMFDAGRIAFTAEVKVNTTMAASYVGNDGSIYCVAPITDSLVSHLVEYWAVGKDCCSRGERASFQCDAASDANAHGAIVLLTEEVGGMALPWALDLRYFDLARLKAEAAFGLAHLGDRVFIRWVTSDTLQTWPKELDKKAWIVIAVVCPTFFVICAAVAFIGLRRPAMMLAASRAM